jgi:outer membrane protein assembly factor BamB
MRGHGWVRLLAAAVLVVTAAGCNWSHPRYGPGRAGHNPLEDRIGAGNVADVAERWAVDLPRPAREVIVTDGLVVAATTPDGAGGDAYVIALDAATGAERWAVAVPGGGCVPGCYGASASLASANGLVFVAWYAGGVGGLIGLDVATRATG